MSTWRVINQKSQVSDQHRYVNAALLSSSSPNCDIVGQWCCTCRKRRTTWCPSGLSFLIPPSKDWSQCSSRPTSPTVSQLLWESALLHQSGNPILCFKPLAIPFLWTLRLLLHHEAFGLNNWSVVFFHNLGIYSSLGLISDWPHRSSKHCKFCVDEHWSCCIWFIHACYFVPWCLSSWFL